MQEPSIFWVASQRLPRSGRCSPMRITAVDIEGFASFDKLSLNDLDPSLNVVVGPNGSGKTNLIGAIRTVRDVLDAASFENRSKWSGMHRINSLSETLEIRVQYELDEGWERQLLTEFVKALIAAGGIMVLPV